MRNHLPHIRPRASPALRSSVLGSSRPQPADYQPLQTASSPGLILQAQRSELCSRTRTPFQFSRVPDPPSSHFFAPSHASAYLGRAHRAAEPRSSRAAAHTAVAIAPPRFCGHFRFLPRPAAFGAGFRPAVPGRT